MNNSSHLTHAVPFLGPLRTEVLSTRQETEDTVTLTLSVPLNYPAWRPGQFNMLYLFGLGEVPISISGDPADLSCLTHTIKAVGAVSRALTSLNSREHVYLRGPFGGGWPTLPKAGRLLIIAGGLGLAPLRPVILQALGHTSPIKTRLLYGVRTPSDIVFREDFPQWQMSQKMATHITADRIASGEPWSGSIGTVTHLLQHVEIAPQETLAMACGPDVMMRHVVSDLCSMGVPNEQIYVSLERNMKCAIGLCGRCQWGPHFICQDGPVYRIADIRHFWTIKDF